MLAINCVPTLECPVLRQAAHAGEVAVLFIGTVEFCKDPAAYLHPALCETNEMDAACGDPKGSLSNETKQLTVQSEAALE